MDAFSDRDHFIAYSNNNDNKVSFASLFAVVFILKKKDKGNKPKKTIRLNAAFKKIEWLIDVWIDCIY